MSTTTNNISNTLSATELSRALHAKELTPKDVLADCKSRIMQREKEIQAWQYLEWPGVEQRLSDLMDIPVQHRGPLWGVPVAVKDIFDTVDMPTSYGSDIYKNHKPAADAACVSTLRAAGALILGKTVSTEFAFWQAGKTRNPKNTRHTPGGSSSGSAAAVADFMVPLALGSQTAASTMRPASYCGVVGFKPTLGLISTASVKALAGSMDTVGFFARTVSDISLLLDALGGGPGERSVVGTEPSLKRDATGVTERLGQLSFRIWNEGEFDAVSDPARSYFERFIAKIGALGIQTLPATGVLGPQPLSRTQTDLMAFEAARELAFEYHNHADALSDVLKQFLEEGQQHTETVWLETRKLRDESLGMLDDYFGEADILVMPSTIDQAPLVEHGTGDPLMSRAWTLLGLPSLSLPLMNEGLELPLGIQLAARPGQDRLLLEVGEWLEQRIGFS